MYVKRDDCTHPEIMGNKWRKLKYNLEEAGRNQSRQIITLGGAYSNHIAATAAACKYFGFQSLGIIRGEELNEESNPTLKKAKENGMELLFVNRTEFRQIKQNPTKFLSAYPNYYFLPEGGTNFLAIRGCSEVIEEIEIGFDVIACSIGTGGTFCGIADSLAQNQQLVGFSALKGSFIRDELNLLFKEYQINHPNFEINTDYHFGGYGKVTSELIDFIDWFKEYFKIQLDPIYTGKCFFGVWDMVKKDKFEKNLRIILLHTGGIQGNEGFIQKNQNII